MKLIENKFVLFGVCELNVKMWSMTYFTEKKPPTLSQSVRWHKASVFHMWLLKGSYRQWVCILEYFSGPLLNSRFYSGCIASGCDLIHPKILGNFLQEQLISYSIYLMLVFHAVTFRNNGELQKSKWFHNPVKMENLLDHIVLLAC